MFHVVDVECFLQRDLYLLVSHHKPAKAVNILKKKSIFPPYLLIKKSVKEVSYQDPGGTGIS